MEAHVIIGANYGDEGKGLMTDYFVRRQNADVVVRFNGGAQAGHTVVDGGVRHVFSHFGSGTLAGAATFLSENFMCNPVLFVVEAQRLGAHLTQVYIDPRSQITIPADMLINQAIERKRGEARHGSCGVGFNEAVERSLSGFPISVLDMLDYRTMQAKIRAVQMDYVPARCAALGLDPALIDAEEFSERFLLDCDFMARHIAIVAPAYISGMTAVFEGAQGLLLDQHNRADFPHLTRSNTGCRNVFKTAVEMGISGAHLVYVTRSYLTRHGAGPLPGEWVKRPEGLYDVTNLPHHFQGTLRYAPLDEAALCGRVIRDAGLCGNLVRSTSIAVTCLDQMQSDIRRRYEARGPRASDVREVVCEPS